MTAETIFKQDYEKHLHYLKLKGLQPQTIDACSRVVRRIDKHFSNEINDLSKQQLTLSKLSRLSVLAPVATIILSPTSSQGNAE